MCQLASRFTKLKIINVVDATFAYTRKFLLNFKKENNCGIYSVKYILFKHI